MHVATPVLLRCKLLLTWLLLWQGCGRVVDRIHDLFCLSVAASRRRPHAINACLLLTIEVDLVAMVQPLLLLQLVVDRFAFLSTWWCPSSSLGMMTIATDENQPRATTEVTLLHIVTTATVALGYDGLLLLHYDAAIAVLMVGLRACLSLLEGTSANSADILAQCGRRRGDLAGLLLNNRLG